MTMNGEYSISPRRHRFDAAVLEWINKATVEGLAAPWTITVKDAEDNNAVFTSVVERGNDGVIYFEHEWTAIEKYDAISLEVEAHKGEGFIVSRLIGLSEPIRAMHA